MKSSTRRTDKSKVWWGVDGSPPSSRAVNPPELLLAVVFLLIVWGAVSPPADAAIAPSVGPNILWIYVEDLSPWIGCYGDPINAGRTPHLDALAARGTRFSRCFMPAPVCSACRSALITGIMQTTTGTHHHRSSRSDASAIALPKGVRTLPEIFRDAGYYTFNQGKDDYNFAYQRATLYEPVKGPAPWRGRSAGQPFFGQIQLKGGKASTQQLVDKVAPADVDVPAYFPDHPIFRRWWAHHYDCVRVTDTQVGAILSHLAADGLKDNTIVFFFSDHGFNHSVRHKQFCFEGGVHVPLIVAGNQLPEDQIRDDLVSGLDISATTLTAAGISPAPGVMGQDLFADGFSGREHVISARDRCDYTIDRIRTVRTDRYRYIRNYLTDRPLLQPQYRDNRDYVQFLRQGHRAGSLPELAERIFFGPRPPEELYDLETDPHELDNLALSPEHGPVLAAHRRTLAHWIEETDDQGQFPESEQNLLRVLRRWKQKCVNPEFDRVRPLISHDAAGQDSR